MGPLLPRCNSSRPTSPGASTVASDRSVSTSAPLCTPSACSEFDWSTVDTSSLPETYRTNSTKEQQLLQVADNFHRQYAHLCPDREPLFLHPVNECGVEVSRGPGIGAWALSCRPPSKARVGFHLEVCIFGQQFLENSWERHGFSLWLLSSSCL